MGLSYAELEDTTPIEFAELQQQSLVARDIENIRFGQVCAVMANLKRTPEQQAWTPFDFFPQLSQVLEVEHENDERNLAVVLGDFFEDMRARTRSRRNKVL